MPIITLLKFVGLGVVGRFLCNFDIGGQPGKNFALYENIVEKYWKYEIIKIYIFKKVILWKLKMKTWLKICRLGKQKSRAKKLSAKKKL